MFEALSRQLARFRALRVEDAERLRGLDRLEGIAFVGPTCAGKSTLVQAIRASASGAGGRLDVPTRYLTRPRRENESPGENVHVSADEFSRLVDGGAIGLHWARKMEGGREERYGFRLTPAGKLPVYSGNNALYANAASVRPEGALRHVLFVGVHAPDDVRAARLKARSPDLVSERPAEVAHRLADSSDNMLTHVHLVVANHGDLEEEAKGEVIALAKALEEEW